MSMPSPGDRPGTCLARTAGSDELDRCPKQRKVLLVLDGIAAIDLDPFARARDAAGLKRDDIASGKMQFRRQGDGHSHPDALAADAGEHPVADEVGVQAV